MKSSFYVGTALLSLLLAHASPAETDRELGRRVQSASVLYMGLTDLPESWLSSKIVDAAAVSNLVSIVQTSEVHSDYWYPRTHEHIIFFCDPSEKPIVAITFLRLKDQVSTRSRVEQFSLFRASLSNDVYMIGQRITPPDSLILDRFAGKGRHLLLRKPFPLNNEYLMDDLLGKRISLENVDRKRFMWQESSPPPSSSKDPAEPGSTSEQSSSALKVESKDDAPPVDTEPLAPKPREIDRE